MTREIADSDDDELALPRSKGHGSVKQSGALTAAARIVTVDIEDPRSGHHPNFALHADSDATQAHGQNYGNEIDIHEAPGYGIDFITPTQRLSSSVDHIEEDTSCLLDSSTNRFLDDIVDEAHHHSTLLEDIDSQAESNKRPYSALTREHPSSIKRVKTYGANITSKTIFSSRAQTDFLDLIHPDHTNGSGNSSHLVSIEPRSQYTSHSESSDLSRKTYGYVPPHCAPQQNFQKIQGLTTSRSSIGNYQSFNLDARDLDKDFREINPFGSLSQLSNAGDLDTEETKGIADIFHKNNNHFPPNSHTTMPEGIRTEAMQPVSDDTLRPPEQLRVAENAIQGSPTYSPISNAEALDEITVGISPLSPPDVDRSSSAHSKTGTKRNEHLVASNDDDIDELQMDEHLSIRDRRADTVDPSAVESLHENFDVKPGRKAKKAKITPVAAESKKLPSSDLGLDNKAIIGLSPERYIPRPSRRRARSESESLIEAIPVEVPAKSKRGRKPKAKKSQTLSKDCSFKADDEDQDELQDSSKECKVEHVADDTDSHLPRRQSNLSVNVPILPPDDGDLEKSIVPEPKKRGRKRKQIVVESHVEPVEESVQESPDQPVAHESVVLTERDVNVAQNVPGVCEGQDTDRTGQQRAETKLDQQDADLPTTEPNLTVTPAKPSSPVKQLPSSSLFNTRARIGLSKRHSIPSLLSKINRDKEAPKVIEKKEKLNKRQLEEREQERIAREEAEAEGREYVPLDVLRNKDGSLIEWDF